ncbi:diguanylate cyclase (GGDEF) domain-containing protein [Nakamurella panacisegetis]|uniref:Diguanylate cyclase (GGDEF) domain-containing protein n=1 Tax=Nakamurella panacisegetis TaxID=1090615 RepID=A0A1H0MJI9_9ACTN|nr:GGDEF domain-containing protein [Nakamurella panacisegetis]SDO80310.1 diguanylate cyclase (GGDEF) domain-containing protein [Nakamurella panacisegetis]
MTALPARDPASAIDHRTMPFRRLSVSFRVLWVVLMAGLIGSYLALLARPLGAVFVGRSTWPALALLLALVVAVEIYPVLPLARQSVAAPTNSVWSGMIWSVSLADAAVLAFGPRAIPLHFIGGLLNSLVEFRRPWWRPWLNATGAGLGGLTSGCAAAAVQTALGGHVGLPWALLVSVVALAVTSRVTNSLLLLGVGATRDRLTLAQLAEQLRQGPSFWGLDSMVTPMLAFVAIQAPVLLLPLLGVAFALRHTAHVLLSRTEQAATDPLTGLANRSAFTFHLDGRLRGRRSATPFSLLVVDLDGFKSVNDTYGHVVGDRVLVEIARRLSEATGPESFLARYGGDEFVVVAPGDLHAAADLRDRVAAELAVPIEVDGRPIALGASIGTAAARDHMAEMDLVSAADEDMYRRKRGGTR